MQIRESALSGFGEIRWSSSAGEVVYALLPPHAADRYTSLTVAGTVGVSFSGHKRSVTRLGAGATRTFDVRPGDAFVSWSGDLEWLQVAEAGEAMEIRFAPQTLAPLADDLGGGNKPIVPDVSGARDLTLWAGSARLRAAMLSGQPVDALALDARLHALAAHVIGRYAGSGPGRRGTAELSARRLARVAEFIDANLAKPMTLAEIAAVACLSVFHFSRAFRNSTGLPPHQFVAARRMQRARELLVGSKRSIEAVAFDAGYASLPHFRACFRAHFGVTPAMMRRAFGPGPAA